MGLSKDLIVGRSKTKVPAMDCDWTEDSTTCKWIQFKFSWPVSASKFLVRLALGSCIDDV
jgi:hypothetical protein